MLRVLEKRVACLLLSLGSVVLSVGASSGDAPQPPSPPVSFPSQVVWTPDGNHIIFSRGFQGIFRVDVAGSELQTIPEDAPMGTTSSPGNALPVLSPDGTRLAFVARLGSQSAVIMVSALNGTGARRLTQGARFNTHPVWSPDGEEIAYIADGKLSVMHADGTNMRVLAPSVGNISAPPEWSPDSSRIAFVGKPQESVHRAVYTVRRNGTRLTRLGATVSVPSWSPDGSRIAMFMPMDEEEVRLYTMDSDGANPQVVWSSDETEFWANNVAWSPDGGAILFSSADGEVVVVSSEKVEERVLARATGERAAWSPDGERFAVISRKSGEEAEGNSGQDLLFTKMRSGMFRRVVVEGNDERLAAKYPGWYDVSRNIAACGRGFEVSDPTAKGFIVERPIENPGLVGDCKILMSIRDRLAGDFLLNWSRETPITEWWGIVLAPSELGYPPRVEALYFGYPHLLAGEGVFQDWPLWLRVAFILGHSIPYYPTPHERSIGHGELNGGVPRELASLTRLGVLYLRGNDLSGSIPAELASSTSLAFLNLSDNKLSGNIPPELGRSQLTIIDLSNNQLSGSIPPELGLLTETITVRTGGSDEDFGLTLLYLANNNLGGTIPPELGNLKSLQYLILSGNRLDGTIPAELGNLDELEWLHLANNNLSGNIPSELGNLAKVRELRLQGNQLTGCVPARFSKASFPVFTVETDGLEFCTE